MGVAGGVTLASKYEVAAGRILLTGVQVLDRLPNVPRQRLPMSVHGYDHVKHAAVQTYRRKLEAGIAELAAAIGSVDGATP
jgi:hypothetical protein